MTVKFKNVKTGEMVEINLFDRKAFNDYMTNGEYLLTFD